MRAGGTTHEEPRTSAFGDSPINQGILDKSWIAPPDLVLSQQSCGEEKWEAKPPVPGTQSSIQDIMGGKAKAKAATASDAPMEPMIAKGNADNTVKAQVNHLKIGNLFLEHAGAVNEGLCARLGVDFMKVPEMEAMTEYFWGMLATYLTTVYISPPGTTNPNQHLGSSTAEIYFNSLLSMTRERLRLSTLPQTKVCARARAPAHAHAHAQHNLRRARVRHMSQLLSNDLATGRIRVCTSSCSCTTSPRARIACA